MKITNIEFNNTTYNNISDLFSALLSVSMNDCLVVVGICANYSDDNPEKNEIKYPDGFHFKSDEAQNLINEQVLSALAKRAQEHDKKRLHDTIRKIMTNTNYKK